VVIKEISMGSGFGWGMDLLNVSTGGSERRVGKLGERKKAKAVLWWGRGENLERLSGKLFCSVESF